MLNVTILAKMISDISRACVLERQNSTRDSRLLEILAFTESCYCPLTYDSFDGLLYHFVYRMFSNQTKRSKET